MLNNAWWPTLIIIGIAAAVDIRSQRIPNWLVFPSLFAGLAFSLSSHGPVNFRQSITGVAVGVTVAGVLCWLRGMGMGDLKLFAAVGAWIGPDQMIIALVATGIVGGFMALLWAAWHRSIRECLDGTGELLSSWRTGLRPHATIVLENPAKLKMPYAPAIALGTIFSFFSN